MEQPVDYPLVNNSTWKQAWSNTKFRTKSIGGIILFISLVLYMPHFFSIIETRQGLLLNDWLLPYIPAYDLSIIIFLLVWSTSLLILVRSIQQPSIFIATIYLLILINVVRMSCIWLIALDPPPGIIHLKDPLTSLTYGGPEIFITKDLFFSGHTSNLFMFYLCLEKKRDKQFALLATITVAALLLVQHVHYTIDIIMAIIFTFLMVRFIKRFSFLNV